ncbi:MAG TPA: hypothetical protein VHQ86_03665, partial [Candidatus Saccharimonadia bacterium]|nr:hypothetical protein [Candidatus Saccharimonadia bacterium]
LDFMRVNLWKPRTRPGYEGVGDKGLPILAKVARAGVNPGLEVIMTEHVHQAMDAALPELGRDGRLLLWIGARNQNHMLQKDIARACLADDRVILMVKNQPWPHEDHWVGIIEHVLDAGFPRERLWNCQRGFTPYGDNPEGFRNVPDFAMMERVRERTGGDIPIIYDPSHMGGTVPNVFEMGRRGAGQNLAGALVEVHHDPKNAMTDKNQQVTWPEFDDLVKVMFPES